jgi:hypothetical protein
VAIGTGAGTDRQGSNAVAISSNIRTLGNRLGNNLPTHSRVGGMMPMGNPQEINIQNPARPWINIMAEEEINYINNAPQRRVPENELRLALNEFIPRENIINRWKYSGGSRNFINEESSINLKLKNVFHLRNYILENFSAFEETI